MTNNRVVVLPCNECEFADSDGKCFTENCIYATDLQRDSFDKEQEQKNHCKWKSIRIFCDNPKRNGLCCGEENCKLCELE